MIALDLQSVLITELQSVFANQLFPKVSDNTGDNPDPVPLNIFAQALPQEQTGDLTVYAPCITVQLLSGKQEEETETEDVRVVLNIGIFDDDPKNQGHVHVSNIIATIRRDFFEKRVFGGKYFFKLPFEWQLNDDDQWPFFYGSIETHWNLPVILPTDPNL